MGDASPSTEHILLAIPFPEPSDIIQTIKKKHPHVEFTVVQIQFTGAKPVTNAIPDGNHVPFLMPKHQILITFSSIMENCHYSRYLQCPPTRSKARAKFEVGAFLQRRNKSHRPNANIHRHKDYLDDILWHSRPSDRRMGHTADSQLFT